MHLTCIILDQALPIESETQRLLSLLAKKVESRDVSQSELSLATGVHQSQISRILSGNVERTSKNVQKLCNYANTHFNADERDREGIEQALKQKLLDLWDGSEPHAGALQDLLSAIDQLQTVKRIRE